MVALIAPLCLGGARAAAPASPPFKVGMAQRAFVPTGAYDWRGDPKHALATVIWYPADAEAQEKPWLIGPPGRPFFDGGRGARDAALAPAAFPLVVDCRGCCIPKLCLN